MRLKSILPVAFVLVFAFGALGSHLDQIAAVVPHGLSERLMRARLAIKAPGFDIEQVVSAMSKKHHVDEAFIKSIIKAESGGDPHVVSNKGAVGLMQLMPTTAQELGADPTIPEQNVEAGTKYFSRLLNRYRKYKNPAVRAIAAYNAGPGFVDKYKGVPPFPETKQYVKRVLSYYREFGGTAIAYAERSAKPVLLAKRAKAQRAAVEPQTAQSDQVEAD